MQPHAAAAPPLPIRPCSRELACFRNALAAPQIVKCTRIRLSQFATETTMLQAGDETTLCRANHFSLWEVVAKICPSLGCCVSGLARVNWLCYLPKVSDVRTELRC